MDGEKRRELILEWLSKQKSPMSGSAIAKKLKVTRQVIVQDIALLRASGYDILATARGYILNQDAGAMQQKIVCVNHPTDKLEEELNIIIDNGGRVRDVIIMHAVYGELVGALMLRTRRDVKQFVQKVKETNALPLLNLTQGIHMHTIEALTQEELDIIEQELKEKGFLYDATE